MARKKKPDMPAHIRSIYDRAEAGKKLTAAEHQVIRQWEARERAAAAGVAQADDPRAWPERPIEEDLEEWTVREGVIGSWTRSLSEIASRHKLTMEGTRAELWRVQRELLRRYGWTGGKKKGPLEGNEALAMQWVISIAQIAKSSAEWEMQMHDLKRARANGDPVDTERYAALTTCLSQLTEKRNGLVTKVRELAVKEKREGGGGRTGPGKGNTFVIEMGKAPLVAPAAEPEKPKE